MCGICGFYQREPVADRAVIQRMNDRIVHRGPDDEGFYLHGPVGLAARRLSIIDLCTGHQPLSTASGKCWIAYNGEVYNFPELRQDLEDRGVPFLTRSDTEVVVNLYEQDGLDFVSRLRGMFAFAIHDQERDRLVLGRDRLGKKPLYYCQRGGSLIFASEIKSILEYPGVDRSVDPEALDHFLSLEYVPAPLSIFRGIRKLPAGSLLVYERGRAEVRPYWDVPAAEVARPLPELREEFLALLEEAVRIRMISDVPFGAFLSGGIDSSAVVAMMARIAGEPVKTFSIGFAERSYNELAHAGKVARLFATDHHERVLDPDIRDLVVKVADGLDEPLGDFSNFPTYLVSRMAREEVTVVLSGDGGDEIFGGYEHYLAQKWAAGPDRLPPARSLVAPLANLFPPSEKKKGLSNGLQRLCQGFEFPAADRHFRWMQFLTAAQKRRLYTQELLTEQALRPLSARSPFAQHFAAARRFSGLNRDLYLDLKTYLADDIMVKVDRMSMLASLETRAPLLDHRVVEFAFALPAKLKVHGLTTKYFFKWALEGILPHETLYRRKEGFSIPIKEWLRHELRELAGDHLASARLKRLGYCRPETVEQWWREHDTGQANHSHRLWPLIVFSLWHQRYLEGAGR